MDDYMRMSKRTARESLYTMSMGVVETFGDMYLRKPSLRDLQELYATHEQRHGFPGMIESIDCEFQQRHGIYIQYSTFMKLFRHPVEERDKFFKRRQERAGKDVERAFGVLKAK
ncbi:uncharacterized protein LOC111906775 [Lactuca sativa]|uniref:uncharacterized protein LOC111906775 n=1 Tax=Lactuca sativa TaxID=4236 RepID=UPI000CD85EE8|nr:uncharacterized protein LOC111906775 [Lactuca sativa]